MNNKWFLFLLFFGLTSLSSAQKLKAKITALPNVSVIDIGKKQYKLTELCKNKVTVVDCWFIPCPPCFYEMKLLHEVYDKYRSNKNFLFITICPTAPDDVRRFLSNDASLKSEVEFYQKLSKLKAFRLPVYFLPGCSKKLYAEVPGGSNGSDSRKDCPEAVFKFKGYPTLMIFNKKGKLIFSKTGYDMEEYARYKKQLEKLLNRELAIKI